MISPANHLRYALDPLCLHPTTEGVQIFSGHNPRRYITTVPSGDLVEWLAENNGYRDHLTHVDIERDERNRMNELAEDLLASLGL